MSEDPEELTPYDLTAEPKAYVFLQPGWAERLEELAPRERDAAMDYESPLIDGITDPEEIRRRITGNMPPPVPTPEGGWTPENIGPEIRRITEAGRPIVVRVPAGNHPPDVIAEAREQYERAAALIRQGWVTRAELEREILGGDVRPVYFSPLRNSLVIREGFAAEKRAAEERERREWTESIRRRLRLVAEVHRCWVWWGVEGTLWTWWCYRLRCPARGGEPSQPEAFAAALAHVRSFIPEPPEEELSGELDWEAYKALAVLAVESEGMEFR